MFVERLPKVPHIPEERKYIASAWMGEGGSPVESAMPGSKGNMLRVLYDSLVVAELQVIFYMVYPLYC